MTIEQDLKNLIKDNLPEQTAIAMREFIDEAEVMKVELSDVIEIANNQSEIISDLQSQIESLSQKIDVYDELTEVQKELEAREKVIQKREDRQEILLLTARLTDKHSHTEALERLVGKVFGHPGVMVSNTCSVQKSIPVETGQGYTSVQQHTDLSSETETTTQTKT